MEFVDILTDNGIKIGNSISKLEAHEKGICHGISAVAVINDEGRVLLAKRSSIKRTEPSKYDLSGCGHIMKNESSEEAAIREIKEEIGLDIRKEDLILIDTYVNKVRLDNECLLNHYTYLYILRSNVSIEDLILDKTEVESVKYVNKQEFLSLKKNNYMVDAMKKCNKLLEYII